MTTEPTTPAPTPPPTRSTGRGALKRNELRERRERDRALAWWRRPGVLLFLASLAIAASGWALVFRAGHRIPVELAHLDGLDLRLEQARWILDQMDHGENFQKPSTMMPDMPDWGKQRVTLEVSFYNRSDAERVVDAAEFFLVPEIGDEVPPMGAQVGRARLAPGQALNTSVHFDFDTREPHGQLRVAWRRADREVFLPIPEPAEHYHLRPRGGEVALPPDARLLLPIGNAARGARLYAGVYGCAACHGDPATAESNNVGPHLGQIGTLASQRVEGLAAEQYIYESILDPGSFIAPECQRGTPCTEPSAMPEYASLIDLQDMADLVTYLLELRGNAPPTPEL